MRFIPETFNRQDWPRLVSQTVNRLVEFAQNSTGTLYMQANSTVTDIVTQNVGVKIAGTTTAGTNNIRFSHSNNRLTYVDGRDRLFMFSAIGDAINGGNNDQYGFSFYKNGSLIAESEKILTADSAGRAGVFAIQAIIDLVSGDFVEVFVRNVSNTADVTISHLNVIAVPVN